MIWCIMTYIIAYVKTQKNKIHNPLLSWWIWINTSCEFIMNDCITTTKQSTTKPCAYFLGYTVAGGPSIIGSTNLTSKAPQSRYKYGFITGYCYNIEPETNFFSWSVPPWGISGAKLISDTYT